MSSAASAVVVGPGAVGCGVVAASLQADGHPFALVGRSAERVDLLRRVGVRVRYSSGPGVPTTLRPTAVVAIDDAALVDAVADAPVVFVAVGSGQARTLVPALATALAARRDPVPVLVCDNRDGAAEALRSLVAEHVVRSVPHRFAGVMVDPIVTRIPSGAGMDLVVESPGGLYVDRAALGGAVPRLSGLQGVDRFASHLTRKRFVFSAGHAAAAYLGGAGGYRTLPEALEDEEVVAVVRTAMREGQVGIEHRFGPGSTGGDEEIGGILARFRCATIADPVDRVGRDPRRKLARGDRICGPALLALEAGRSPAGLAVSAAAALWWGSSLDPELVARREQRGPRSLLARLTALDEHHPFVDQALAGYAVLSSGGSPGRALRTAARQLAPGTSR